MKNAGPREVGPAKFTVQVLPCGFTPTKYAIERRAPLEGGGERVTFFSTPTTDPVEAEMLAFSAARNEPGSTAVSFIGDNIPNTCETF